MWYGFRLIVLYFVISREFRTGLQIRVQHWGDDHHVLVTFFDIGGDDFKISFFDDLIFARQAFFHHFLLKFNYWGDGCPNPPGICSPGLNNFSY